MAAALERALSKAKRPLVVGLCGPQGSGKSTLAAAMTRRFDRAVALSLDDLYLTRAERDDLARTVHPLFATRGPPGTHDLELGLATLAALDRGEPVALPRFDKAIDDRVSTGPIDHAPPGCRLVIFEGWCVGATPQSPSALQAPINRLECEEDAAATWRTYANRALAGGYQQLFARIDLLVFLRAPGWHAVLEWRREQEQTLRRSGARGAGLMSDDEIERFVSHYERLTRHMLEEMPARADLVIDLDDQRRCLSIEGPVSDDIEARVRDNIASSENGGRSVHPRPTSKS
nr:kinase [Hephaestia mangrovi]